MVHLKRIFNPILRILSKVIFSKINQILNQFLQEGKCKIQIKMGPQPLAEDSKTK